MSNLNNSLPFWKVKVNKFNINYKKFLVFIFSIIIIPYISYIGIAGLLNWTELQNKTTRVYITDLIIITGSSILIYFGGNYYETFGWITYASFISSLFIFGKICELHFTKRSLTSSSVDYWTPQLYTLVIFGLIIVSIITFIHIYLAYKNLSVKKRMVYYICSFIPFLMFMYIVLIISKKIDCDFHLHHSEIFFILCFFTRFNDVISKLCAGVCLGIFLQGVSSYQLETIIYN